MSVPETAPTGDSVQVGAERVGCVSAARVDELRAQARYARQKYDLYKARTYGPRLTSPTRLRELERECERAEAGFRFARDSLGQSR
jgi:hypothetical protein